MAGSTTIAYFGGAAFKITTAKGKKILIDPYLTENPLCKTPLEDFFDIDLLLVSHGAFDHLGDTVEIMKRSKAVLVCGMDVREHVQQAGIAKDRVKVTVYGDEKNFEGIKTKTVDARHISSVAIENGRLSGVPHGFVITTEDGTRLYHTGDTSLFGDLRMIGMLYRPNVLMLCISTVSEGLAFEMTPQEAALATQWVAPDIAVPMHFPPGSDAPRKFSEAVKIVAPNVEPVVIEPNSQIRYKRWELG
ncbi:MAG: metal-dependent hydrolase [Chloroflexi bacterium]|nr:metal-dependent hydrolase [Chloroflexota bacterium]